MHLRKGLIDGNQFQERKNYRMPVEGAGVKEAVQQTDSSAKLRPRSPWARLHVSVV